jgi:hypothetical protein
MTDGFALAGPGLADDDVPRQFVNVLAAALELLQAGLELLSQLVQSRALVGVADGLGRRSRLRLESGGELVAPAPGPLPAPEPVAAEEQQGQADDRQGDIKRVQPGEKSKCSHYGAQAAQAGGAQHPLRHSAIS